METYRDLIGELARNVGFETDVEKEKGQLLSAIYWAETLLQRKTDAVKFLEKITINKNVESFELPLDFNTQQEVVITDRNLNRYLTKEVEVDLLLRYEPLPNVEVVTLGDLAINPKFLKATTLQIEDDARYYGYLLYAFNRTADNYEIMLKPRVDGFIFLYYSGNALAPTEIEATYSALPRSYWTGIVSGATYYLLLRQMRGLIGIDANKAASMRLLISEYKGQFNSDMADLDQEKMKRAGPLVMKPFSLWAPENDIQEGEKGRSW